MIERQIVDGRPAMVAYINPAEGGGFDSATPQTASMIKVIWDDGDTAFMRNTPTPPLDVKHQLIAMKARMGRLKDMLKAYNPKQPRTPKGSGRVSGRWTGSGLEAALAPTGEPKTGIGAFGHFFVSDKDKAELHGMLDRSVPFTEIEKHPAIQSAMLEAAKIPRTDLKPGYGSEEWEKNREFEGGIKGYDAAVDHLIGVADKYAGGEVKYEKEATILLGPPAAGKSDFAEMLAKAEHSAIVDADDAKKIMKEYRGGIGAHAVHEESSVLARDVFTRLTEKGSNMILPKVGGGAESINRVTKGLRSMGYRVNLINMAVSEDNALKRSVARFASTGRLVNMEYSKEVDGNPTRTYNTLKGNGDFTQVVGIDNNYPKGEYVITEGQGSRLGQALDRSRHARR